MKHIYRQEHAHIINKAKLHFWSFNNSDIVALVP